MIWLWFEMYASDYKKAENLSVHWIQTRLILGKADVDTSNCVEQSRSWFHN